MRDNNDLEAWAKAIIATLLTRWREVVPLLVVVALLIAGERRAERSTYLLLLALLACAVLVCNPCCLLDRLAAPASRGLWTAAVVLVAAAASLWWLDPYLRVWLVVLAVLLAGLGIWQRRTWLTGYLLRQSPAVDRALSSLAGNTSQATKAWQQHGKRETRATLHQYAGVVVTERELDTTARIVYELAWWQGAAELERVQQQARRREQTLLNRLNDLQETLYIRSQYGDPVTTRDDLATAAADQQRRADRWMAHAKDLERRLQEAHADMDELHPLHTQGAEEVQPLSLVERAPTQAERDAAMLAYHMDGHSIRETGAAYGMSKAGAQAAINRARQAERKQA